MPIRYLDTSSRRVPVRFMARTLADAGAGRRAATYADPSDVSFVNFKTKGGTQTVTDGVLSVIATATVTMTYRPDVKRGDRVECLADGTTWDVLNVENVDMQCRDMVLTVRAVEGVA